MHLGTLTAAVASYLHARRSKGTWLVRLEDIDPPREVAGSASAILETLEALDLEWDGEVLYQRTRLATHQETAGRLVASGAAYYCDCSRLQIRSVTGSTRYPGTCRQRSVPPGDAAVRLRVGNVPVAFTDGIQGEIQRDIDASDGDFIIVRRDGLPAYHLAVALDDAWQGVTDVVRGADLVDSTPLHIHLQRVLGLPTPRYWHIPLITDAAGRKLSKSTGAVAIDRKEPEKAAAAALALLGLTVPDELSGARPRALWDWASLHWRLESLADRPDPIVLAD